MQLPGLWQVHSLCVRLKMSYICVTCGWFMGYWVAYWPRTKALGCRDTGWVSFRSFMAGAWCTRSFRCGQAGSSSLWGFGELHLSDGMYSTYHMVHHGTTLGGIKLCILSISMSIFVNFCHRYHRYHRFWPRMANHCCFSCSFWSCSRGFLPFDPDVGHWGAGFCAHLFGSKFQIFQDLLAMLHWFYNILYYIYVYVYIYMLYIYILYIILYVYIYMYPYMYIDFISSLPLRLKILSSGPRKRFAPAAALGTTVVSQLMFEI